MQTNEHREVHEVTQVDVDAAWVSFMRGITDDALASPEVKKVLNAVQKLPMTTQFWVIKIADAMTTLIRPNIEAGGAAIMLLLEIEAATRLRSNAHER